MNLIDTPFRRRAWILSFALVVFGGCTRDDERPLQDDDPFDDPWVDGIDTGEELSRPTVAPVTPDPAPTTGDLSGGSAEGVALALAEVDSRDATTPAPTSDPTSQDTPTPAGEGPPVAQEPPAGEGPPAGEEPLAAEEPPAEAAPSVESAAAPEPAAAPSPPPITSADFHGNYRYVGGQAQRDGVADAIETTVSALSPVLHGIARRRLTEVNPVDGTVDIVVAGDKVTTTFESGFTVTAVIDGATASAKAIDGSKLEVRLRTKDNKLVQQMVGKGGGRTIVYVLSADRKQLTVHSKITSKRLPVPLTYRLTYARK